jgi:hypothetical protein
LTASGRQLQVEAEDAGASHFSSVPSSGAGPIKPSLPVAPGSCVTPRRAVDAAILMASIHVRAESLCLFDAPMPTLQGIEFGHWESSMDVLFLGASALMFIALIGMVIGCDMLGVRK